jgi:hypothetical protein
MPQYSARSQFGHRKPLSRFIRQRILNRDANTCIYCGYEANVVDHIIPYSHGGTDDDDNLAACCDVCNNIVSDLVFDTLEAKRAYIRSKYGKHLEGRVRRSRRKLSICADCQNVYNPQHRGATNVLCAECYRRDDLGLNGTLRENVSSYDAGDDPRATGLHCPQGHRVIRERGGR